MKGWMLWHFSAERILGKPMRANAAGPRHRQLFIAADLIA
jgi:hypothetical protein